MDAWMREVGILAPPSPAPAAARFWVTVRCFCPQLTKSSEWSHDARGWQMWACAVEVKAEFLLTVPFFHPPARRRQ